MASIDGRQGRREDKGDFLLSPLPALPEFAQT